MRRIRHLSYPDYLCVIGGRTAQPMLSSNNILLEKVSSFESRSEIQAVLHAKFNADAMNGIQIRAGLINGVRLLSSSPISCRVLRVADSSWVETFVANVTLSSVGLYLEGSINQAALGANELSGRETYSIEVSIGRRNRKFRKKVWFNHLGCFDNINLARQKIDLLEIGKLDE